VCVSAVRVQRGRNIYAGYRGNGIAVRRSPGGESMSREEKRRIVLASVNGAYPDGTYTGERIELKKLLGSIDDEKKNVNARTRVHNGVSTTNL